MGGVCCVELVLRCTLGLLARSSRSSCVRSWCRLWCSCISVGVARSEFTNSFTVRDLVLFFILLSLNLVFSSSARWYSLEMKFALAASFIVATCAGLFRLSPIPSYSVLNPC